MKNFKKILFILICILIAFIGGMFFMNGSSTVVKS